MTRAELEAAYEMQRAMLERLQQARPRPAFSDLLLAEVRVAQAKQKIYDLASAEKRAREEAREPRAVIEEWHCPLCGAVRPMSASSCPCIWGEK